MDAGEVGGTVGGYGRYVKWAYGGDRLRMAKDWLRYDQIVERQLRGVVRYVLAEVAANGLPGDHHFYITFKTGHPGVSMSPHLKAQYPREMTIVLQHQYWGLEVLDDSVTVTLSFGGRHERLQVPFAAVVSFADPSVKFALQFEATSQGDESADDAEGEDEGYDGEDAADVAGKSAGKSPEKSTGKSSARELAALPRDLNDLPPVALKPGAAKPEASKIETAKLAGKEKTVERGDDAGEKSSTVVALDSFRKKQ